MKYTGRCLPAKGHQVPVPTPHRAPPPPGSPGGGPLEASRRRQRRSGGNRQSHRWGGPGDAPLLAITSSSHQDGQQSSGSSGQAHATATPDLRARAGIRWELRPGQIPDTWGGAPGAGCTPGGHTASEDPEWTVWATVPVTPGTHGPLGRQRNPPPATCTPQRPLQPLPAWHPRRPQHRRSRLCVRQRPLCGEGLAHRFASPGRFLP